MAIFIKTRNGLYNMDMGQLYLDNSALILQTGKKEITIHTWPHADKLLGRIADEISLIRNPRDGWSQIMNDGTRKPMYPVTKFPDGIIDIYKLLEDIEEDTYANKELQI